MLTYGIDEAGRGPILGPMVVAVVAVTEGQAAALDGRGVRDSKAYGSGARAHERRSEIVRQLAHLTSSAVFEVVSVATIDAYTNRGALNELEREVAARLLGRLAAPAEATIIADGARMFAPLTRAFPNLKAVDRGESAHVSVAAASILAKTVRDNEFSAIAVRYAAEYGPLSGGGYLNAPTRRFIDTYKAKHGSPPPETRLSWGAKKS
jgi:ribonuclease HII